MSETSDIAWDDDTAPRFELDEPSFDRITAIPELPSEVYAKRMMSAFDDPAALPPRAALREDDPVSGTFERGDEPASAGGPFELAAALVSSIPPPQGSLSPPTRPHKPDAAELARAVRGMPTLPPFAPHDDEKTEPGLEVDAKALDSAVAARGRPALRPPVRNQERPRSLELDLSGFEEGPSVPPQSDPILRQLKDRYAMGDYSGALVVAEGVLQNDPDHVEALRFAKNCRDVLAQMYAARLGALDQVVNVGIPNEQIRWLSLDHRAGFLLSLVDGSLNLEEILDISGMPRLDAMRIMCSLLEERVISLRSGAR